MIKILLQIFFKICFHREDITKVVWAAKGMNLVDPLIFKTPRKSGTNVFFLHFLMTSEAFSH